MTREQLEEQAEHNRAQIANTLEELNRRLTPGQLVDQVLGYMKDGGDEFLSNFGRQVTNNPLPITLIGAGLAWFLFGKNAPTTGNGTQPGSRISSPHISSRGNGSSYAARTASAVGETARAAGDGVGDAMHTAADAASDAYHTAGEAASSAYHAVGDAASSVGGAARGAYRAASDAASTVSDAASGAYNAVGDAASDAYRTAGDAASSAYYKAQDTLASVKTSAIEAEEKTVAAARSALAFCQDQPLILAGAGLALGAAIGAMLPGTKFEDELMGEASDDVKDAAGDMAMEGLDKAWTAGEKIGAVVEHDIKETSHKIADVMKQDIKATSEKLGDTVKGDIDAVSEKLDSAMEDTKNASRKIGAVQEDIAAADPAAGACSPSEPSFGNMRRT
jgi:hypothetical protein